jgi:hypothetical protein
VPARVGEHTLSVRVAGGATLSQVRYVVRDRRF